MKVYSDRADFYRERGIRLKKIGERSGDEMGDEHKPKPQIPKRETYYDLPMQQKKIVASEFSNRLKKDATKSEIAFRHELYNWGVKHLFQFEMMDDDNLVIADFYISKLHLVIEVDGGYHTDKRQIARDNYKNEFYKKNGLIVLRLRNEEVLTFNYELLAEWYKSGKINVRYANMFCAIGRRLDEEPKRVSSNKNKLPKKYQKKKKRRSKKKNGKFGDHSITKNGQACRHCGTPVKVKNTKKNRKFKKNQKYAYKRYFYCPKCHTMYMDEKSKYYL